MRFTNLTRAVEIGANSYLIEIGGKRLVLDCGMHPKGEGDGATPNFAAIGDQPLDAIVVSHAHQDHIGTLPLLMRRHPDTPVFMTQATADIGGALLHNSVNVMTKQREELGVTLYPLFTHRETERAVDQWNVWPMRQPFTVEGERANASDRDGLTIEFIDAGHVLGSAGVIIRAEGRTIFYTGDVNFDDQTIMQGAKFPESDADGRKIDILIIEATRGDNPQPEGWTRDGEERRLAKAIDAAFARGGCVLVPVFALGKTQELLAMLYKFRREKLLSDFPIYIGGLSAKMTEVYDRRANMSRRKLGKLNLMEDVAPFVLNGQTIAETPAKAGRIYALSSGMMTTKTLSNTFARRVIEDPKHSTFFVGYADPASPAGILRAAKQGDEVSLDPELPPQRVRCHIEAFQFSAHASRESLVDYAARVGAKKTIIIHGDAPAVEWLRAQVSAKVAGGEVIVPTPGVALEF